MQLLPNTWEKGITTSLGLIITQIKVEACYADLFFFFVNGTNIKKNHTTVWIIYSIKISVEYLKILY